MKKKEMNNLREKLRTGQPLSATFNYFFDHFGEDEAFVENGRQLENRKLMTMLGATCQQLLNMGNLVGMREMFMIENSEHGIFHGHFLVANRLATYFFFPDMDMGLLAVTGEKLGDGGTSFARFTGAVLPEGGGGLLVVPGDASSYN